jgi:hypothetical protein
MIHWCQIHCVETELLTYVLYSCLLSIFQTGHNSVSKITPIISLADSSTLLPNPEITKWTHTTKMIKKTIVVSFLTVLSVITLAGALSVPSADAAENPPREIKNGPVSLDARGIEIDSKEFQIDLSASGFTIESPFFP